MIESDVKINIVCVNFNSSLETVQMVDSLDASGINFKLIVVDNKSNCDQVSLLEESLKDNDKVYLVLSSENIGYFPALNKGLEQISAVEKRSSFTIVCNNDLLFNTDFFQQLYTSTYEKNVMAIAPSVKTINGVYQNPSMACKPSLLRYLMYRMYYSNYWVGKVMLKIWRTLGLGIDTNFTKDNAERDIFIGIGAIYVLLPSFFNVNDKLDYPLFLYGEEAFFSQQLAKSKGRLLYKPNMEVIHLESVSTKKIPSKDNYELNKLAFLTYKSFFR